MHKIASILQHTKCNYLSDDAITTALFEVLVSEFWLMTRCFQRAISGTDGIAGGKALMMIQDHFNAKAVLRKDTVTL